MAKHLRHGWLKIPGVQHGDRSLQEQMLGLIPALKEANGKKVLDVGCAEGLIGFEFYKSGAEVTGFDRLEEHISVAKKQCPGVGFKVCDLNAMNIPERPEYDIVLALAVLHKLIDPSHGARFCCASSKSLVVIRLPRGSKGLIAGKHSKVECDLHKVMGGEGFKLERIEGGPFKEMVQYWRR